MVGRNFFEYTVVNRVNWPEFFFLSCFVSCCNLWFTDDPYQSISYNVLHGSLVTRELLNRNVDRCINYYLYRNTLYTI